MPSPDVPSREDGSGDDPGRPCLPGRQRTMAAALPACGGPRRPDIAGAHPFHAVG
mgnify:CR=1 FL=1